MEPEDGLVFHTYYVGDIIGAEGQRLDGRDPGTSAMQSIMDLITSTIAPETWRETGEPGPSITPFYLSVSLIIRHDRATHERIAVLLGQLRRLQNSRLDAPPPARPLPPPRVISTTRIRPPAPSAPPPPGPEEARPELVNRSYGIGDLIGIAPGPVEDPDAIPDSVWPLVELIAKEVAPGSWMKGGFGGWARPYYGRILKEPSEDGRRRIDPNRPLMLLVRQTAEVQDQVKAFLDGLRRAQELRKPASAK